MSFEDFYFRQIKKLVEFAYKHSAFYRKKYKANNFAPNDFKKLDDIEKIPIVTRQDIVENFENIITTPFRSYLTSELQRQELPRVFLSPEERIRRYIIFIRTLKKLGYKSYRKTLIYSHQKFEKNILNFFGLFRFVQVPIQFSVEKQIDLLKRVKAKQIIYNPFSLFKICKVLEEKGWQVENPQLLVTQSEILPNFVRNVIEAHLGTVSEVYAASEVGYIGWKGRDDEFFSVNWDSLFLEALRLSDNSHVKSEKEYGKCIVTSLINFAFPLIRYDLEDVIKVIPENFYTLKIKSVEGKYADAFLYKGRLITPLAFTEKMMHIIQDLFTLVVGKKVALFVESKNENIEKAKRILIKLFNKKIIIMRCRVLPKTITGKYYTILRRLR
jgi:phenylacetate-CoA ligase